MTLKLLVGGGTVAEPSLSLGGTVAEPALSLGVELKNASPEFASLKYFFSECSSSDTTARQVKSKSHLRFAIVFQLKTDWMVSFVLAPFIAQGNG